jgi:adenylyltransferase/sulfurtransferase
VREPFEAAIARIEGSELIPLGRLGQSIDRIRTDVPVVLYCHHGPRSQQGAAVLRRAGVTHVTDLAGGIDAYARDVDPALARY